MKDIRSPNLAEDLLSPTSVESSRPGAHSNEAATSALSRLSTPQLLLFFDDLEAARALQRHMAQLGCNCAIAGEPTQGLLSQVPFDVAVLDLPPLEARHDAGAQRILRLGLQTRPLVLISSAEINSAAAADSADSASLALTKPFLPEALLAAAREVYLRSQNRPKKRASSIASAEGRVPRGIPDLESRWEKVLAAMDDDAAHQHFIQGCLSLQNVEYAIHRYRELSVRNPSDPRLERYLRQLGTILSFYALKKDESLVPERKIPMGIKLLTGFFVLGVVVLWVLAAFFAK